jgi:hypothetical protein
LKVYIEQTEGTTTTVSDNCVPDNKLTKLVAVEKEVEPWLANITTNMEPRDIECYILLHRVGLYSQDQVSIIGVILPIDKGPARATETPPMDMPVTL